MFVLDAIGALVLPVADGVQGITFLADSAGEEADALALLHWSMAHGVTV